MFLGNRNKVGLGIPSSISPAPPLKPVQTYPCFDSDGRSCASADPKGNMSFKHIYSHLSNMFNPEHPAVNKFNIFSEHNVYIILYIPECKL